MSRFTLPLATTVLCAQVAVFDAASVRPARPAAGEERRGARIAASPGGVTVHGSSLRDCMQWAWDLREYQLDGPDWITFERYDIATRTGAPAELPGLRERMRALLTERFQLRLRRERREMPVLALIPGRRGPKLDASSNERQAMLRLPGGGLRLEFRGTSVAGLAAFLSTLAVVGRPVYDRSELTGVYDFRLDLHEAAGPWATEAEHLAAPSIATVVEEQLGLRLERRREAVEVLVVERAARPSDN
jgi:uncharacterized protein (TIGR03435 family)